MRRFSLHVALLITACGLSWLQATAQQPPLPVLPVAPGAPPALPLPTPPGDVPAPPPVTLPSTAPAAVPAPNPAEVSPPTPTNDPTDGGAATPKEAAPSEKRYSFGASTVSILFLPDQVAKMREAVIAFENGDSGAQPNQPVTPVPVAQPVENLTEPAAGYPVFFLTSIAYRNPADWTLWIAGHKITSRRNDTDVKVVAVGPETATFTWAPDYAKAIVRRKKDSLFASTDAVKNKLATSQRVSIDESTGALTFSLRQNQSFAVGYFRIFEGYMESPKLVPLQTLPAGAGGDNATAMYPNMMPPPDAPMPEDDPNMVPPGPYQLPQ